MQTADRIERLEAGSRVRVSLAAIGQVGIVNGIDEDALLIAVAVVARTQLQRIEVSPINEVRRLSAPFRVLAGAGD
ncbi:MAG: hypothetical protein JJE47_09505 [Acidimicrobiia bacterium]|nr:hypothetical protein [Acidimicrobiia bacterium]